ncbi:glycosyltransferase [Candidatus Saccharibacteria bacterium]|nr:glycosyltransferase [Candidatus Saccharibacteria bacterium]NIS37694.1 glycosyltransferase [Candidatus Saccharibacteria bacterium]NIV03188.1 glycosyltransferase [Calditrichia bacterium]NIV71300.1 glycosyltransferase [Calditrichia bacterium]NIW78068.1 glycosyltransferase [Calditrichia bacterium]
MDKMKPRVAAIIPAYNEEKTIGPIIKTLKASPLIDEVIVISDGSDDDTIRICNEIGPEICHQLPVKSGKGKAMQHGVTHTDAPIIFFFDADLIGLNEKHISAILEPVIRGERAMNVGIRDRGPFAMRMASHLPLIGGERAMIRQVFEDVPEKYKQGFMAEIAMNYYCRSRKLKYGCSPCPGLTIRRKMQKVGVIKGFLEYVSMSFQVIKAMVIVRSARLMGKF